jgi:hypothetical protein
MGVYHFHLTVVPRAYFDQKLPIVLSEAEIEQGDDGSCGWWASHPPSEHFLVAIRNLLPTDKSWGETEEYVSADDWSSDVRVWKEAGRVWGITFRFAPISDGWPLMQRFLAVARDEQCVLIEEKSRSVFEPDEQTVRERMAASHAMQFVRNPESAIVQAARDLEEDTGDRGISGK